MADEEFEKLKREADKAPEKYKKALEFLKKHTFNFDDEYYFISRSFNDGNRAKGSFKIIPLSFKVMIRVGIPTMYLNSRIVFEKIKFEDPEINQIFKDFLNQGTYGTSLLSISSVFKNAPMEEFNKIKKLIAMNNLELLIGEVDIEKIK